MLDDKTVEVIIEDITREIEFCKGEMPYIEVWKNLREKAEEEKKCRKAVSGIIKRTESANKSIQ